MNNPAVSSTGFRLQLQSSDAATPVQLRILHLNGKAIANWQNLAPGTTIEAGHDWIPGLYIGEAVQGRKRVMVKLMKL
jgi:hypothetical protein